MPELSQKPHVVGFDEDWMARRIEAPLPCDSEIVDGHIHLWDFSEPAYFGDRYRDDARAAGIAASVYVECTMGYRGDGPEDERAIGEVEFAARQGDSHSERGIDVGAAIVGMLDARRDDTVPKLLDMMAKAGGGRFRGIRIRAAHDPDPAVGYGVGGVPAGLLADPRVRASLKLLRDAGYSLDVYVFHTQLGEVEDLARALPDLPIALNHAGGPIGIGRYASDRRGVAAAWRDAMSSLARCGNVSVKIGGFAIARLAIVDASGRAEPPSSEELAADFAPWFEHCLESFGARRCMFGSNFPVDKAHMTMVSLVNAMKRLTTSLDREDRNAVLAGTARRFYRI